MDMLYEHVHSVELCQGEEVLMTGGKNVITAFTGTKSTALTHSTVRRVAPPVLSLLRLLSGVLLLLRRLCKLSMSPRLRRRCLRRYCISE